MARLLSPKRATIRHVRTLQGYVKPKAQLVKQSVCSWGFICTAVKTMGLILFYYTFSIGLTFYNQRFIGHFPYPLSITMTHLVVKFMLAGFIRAIIELKTKELRVLLPWGVYFKKIAPTGIASALDIGLSNWSFEFITVSLYTMSKSSAVLFILIFSVIFKLERMRWQLVFVVLFISCGLFMFTYQSTQFEWHGFAMALTAAVLSGLRWTLAQLVTQKSELGLGNPLDMMYHIQPWMMVSLLPLSGGFEGLSVATTEHAFNYHSSSILMRNLSILFAGALMAFMLEFSEFLLLRHTSSLTLAISGIFKEICTLYLAYQFNGDKMNLVNGIGLVVCLLGISVHIVIKAVSGDINSQSPATQSDDSMEMLMRDGKANTGDDEDDEEIDIYTRPISR